MAFNSFLIPILSILSIATDFYFVQSSAFVCTSLASKFDILFLVDSTTNVGNETNHIMILEFIMEILENLDADYEELLDLKNDWKDFRNMFAMAQFTPDLLIEFGFNELAAEFNRLSSTNGGGNLPQQKEGSLNRMRRRIMNAPFLPRAITPLDILHAETSLNSIASHFFGADSIGFLAAKEIDRGNRPSIPDLVILISTSAYRPPELKTGETLIQPQAPIHFFIITIGANTMAMPYAMKPVEFAATTVHLGCKDFTDLPDLVEPLCESLHSFLGDGRTDEDDDAPIPASLCLTCLILLAICFVILVFILCYAANKYRNEGLRYQNLMKMEQDKLQKLDEHYKRKLQEQQEIGHGEENLLPLESLSQLPLDHPAVKLPPVDVLFLIDASGSIGNNTFEQIKTSLCKIVHNIDVAAGRSRIATVLFGSEPYVHFDFNRFYTINSVRAAIRKMPYLGGGTRLSKALAFASGMVAKEQTFFMAVINGKTGEEHHLHNMPTPRHERLQVIILVSDGSSDDNFDQETMVLNEHLHIKMAAIVTKRFYKDRLKPVTRYEEAIFTLGQTEAISIWLWNQQKMWNERFGSFVEREKSFLVPPRELSLDKHDSRADESVGGVKKY